MFEYDPIKEKKFHLVQSGKKDGHRVLFFLKEDVKNWLADKEHSTKLVEIFPFYFLERKVEIIVFYDENLYIEFLLAWT